MPMKSGCAIGIRMIRARVRDQSMNDGVILDPETTGKTTLSESSHGPLLRKVMHKRLAHVFSEETVVDQYLAQDFQGLITFA